MQVRLAGSSLNILSITETRSCFRLEVDPQPHNTDVLITGRWWKVEGARWNGGLKPRSEPDAYGDAGAYTNDVDKDFEDRDNEESAETHRLRQVEVLRQLGPTM